MPFTRGRPARSGKYGAGKAAPAGIGRATEMVGAGLLRVVLQLLRDRQARRRNGTRGGGPAKLVVDHTELVAGFRQPQHGFDRIRTMGGKHPGDAQNGMGGTAGANALLARPFAAAIGIGRAVASSGIHDTWPVPAKT